MFAREGNREGSHSEQATATGHSEQRDTHLCAGANLDVSLFDGHNGLADDIKRGLLDRHRIGRVRRVSKGQLQRLDRVAFDQWLHLRIAFGDGGHECGVVGIGDDRRIELLCLGDHRGPHT